MVEKMPIPVMNESTQPRVKFRFPNARRSTTGRGKVRLRMTNRTPATPAMIAQSLMVASSNQFHPRPFLKHVLQGSKRDRHEDDAGIVGSLKQRKIGLVDLQQKRD